MRHLEHRCRRVTPRSPKRNPAAPQRSALNSTGRSRWPTRSRRRRRPLDEPVRYLQPGRDSESDRGRVDAGGEARGDCSESAEGHDTKGARARDEGAGTRLRLRLEGTKRRPVTRGAFSSAEHPHLGPGIGLRQPGVTSSAAVAAASARSVASPNRNPTESPTRTRNTSAPAISSTRPLAAAAPSGALA